MWLDPPKSESKPDGSDSVGPPVELTTSEVMWMLGHKNTRCTISWCNRNNVQAKYRRPGAHGENVYYKVDVERALAAMPGRGVGGGWHKHKKRRKPEGG